MLPQLPSDRRIGGERSCALREAAELWESSPIARAAFGTEVVEHYRHMARVEQDAYDAAVTDWERFRSFERMYGTRTCCTS